MDGMTVMISGRHPFLWGERDKSILKVSTTQPNRTWNVDQEKSTWSIFFMEMTSLYYGDSTAYLGQKNWYRERNKVRWMCRWWCAGPWDNPGFF